VQALSALLRRISTYTTNFRITPVPTVSQTLKLQSNCSRGNPLKVLVLCSLALTALATQFNLERGHAAQTAVPAIYLNLLALMHGVPCRGNPEQVGPNAFGNHLALRCMLQSNVSNCDRGSHVPTRCGSHPPGSLRSSNQRSDRSLETHSLHAWDGCGDEQARAAPARIAMEPSISAAVKGQYAGSSAKATSPVNHDCTWIWQSLSKIQPLEAAHFCRQLALLRLSTCGF
jgi:hypothetical protein